FPELSIFLNGDAEFKKFAASFLRGAATGVHSLEAVQQELSEEEVGGLLPFHVMSDMKARLNQSKSRVVGVLFGDEQLQLNDSSGKERWFREQIQAGHQNAVGENYALEMKDESDGTRRLLDLMPVLYSLQSKDITFVIDEIDRSLHPMLVRKFLEFFLKTVGEGRRQVIVTTHAICRGGLAQYLFWAISIV
ncbi:MAG: ATP-binding protein, partial [Burkholderiales bacterium]|nr:ATP-binding protein [Burkholderiales bacterium]